MIGRTLSHYLITAHIGQGGMGVVYRARDQRLERDVALKVLVPGLLADESARRRFRKEALALSTLNHPNAQTVHDFDTEAEVDFLVTEYVPGVTLTERVTAGGLPEKEVLRLGVQLADGLAAAHAHGIIHRDLKPANLRLTPDGRLKILDFGLARAPALVDAATTRSLGDTHTFAGTLPYMAPEQLRGEILDARTDLFAAGCVLYEMSTGRRAFIDELVPRLTDAILHDDPVAPRVINPQMSPELERIVLKCVEKDPGERYQSATELGVDLRRLEAGRVALTTTSSGPAAKRRRLLAWAGGGAGVTLLAGVLTIGTGRSRDVPVSVGEPARIRSLAVLPLANLTGDPEQEYFVAGMQDALIAELGQIGALSVISRTSTMRYRNTEKAVPEIARELGVDALVEGSTFREGENVHIQVQLIGAAPVERNLWSGTYDGDLRNVLTLQKRVSRAIADQIQVQLTPQEAARLATARAVNPAAYDAWAKGWFEFSRITAESLRRCLVHADAALAIDPSYAPAYALSGSCLGFLPSVASVHPQDAFPKAETAARRALQLDDGLADAHFALAWVLAQYHWDWASAEREYRRGLELNPGATYGRSAFGWVLSWMGRHDEALAEVKRVEQLSPASPSELQRAAGVHIAARRYDDAIAAARRAIEIEANYAYAYLRLGQAYTAKAMHNEAIATLERGATLFGGTGPHRAALARAYTLVGRRRDAQRILSELLAADRRGYVERTSLATIYAALGDKDEAMRWLEQGYQMHDGNMVLIKVQPFWDPLRGDPRFQDLLRRMKFPD